MPSTRPGDNLIGRAMFEETAPGWSRFALGKIALIWDSLEHRHAQARLPRTNETSEAFGWRPSFLSFAFGCG